MNSTANQYITKKLDWVEREEEREGKIYVDQRSFSICLNFLIPFILSFLVIELYFMLEGTSQSSSSLTPTSKQAWLDQLVQGSVQLTLDTWTLPTTNWTTSLGNVFQYLVTLTVQFFFANV